MKRSLLVLSLLSVAFGLVVLFQSRWERAPNPPAATTSAPQKDGSGAYPLLVSSLLAGDITEFKPADVRKWGDATEETVDGIRQWRVNLICEVNTKFGPFEVGASAHVRDGKVLKWTYTDSGEVIP